MTSFAVQFLWGLVVLSGFIGWGVAVARAFDRPRPDWGLSAGFKRLLLLSIRSSRLLFSQKKQVGMRRVVLLLTRS